MYSRVKLFGHPIHPMVVAYPIAFYTATLAAFIIKAAVKGPFWIKVAIATNVAGVAMAIVAAIPGFIDWMVGIPRGIRAKSTGLRHMLFNLAALALFAVTLDIYISHWNGPFKLNVWPGIILSALGVLCTITAGLFGWTLVQDHHVGVNIPPGPTTADLERETPMPRAG
jgi:uncharacterized membrane protein